MEKKKESRNPSEHLKEVNREKRQEKWRENEGGEARDRERKGKGPERQ